MADPQKSEQTREFINSYADIAKKMTVLARMHARQFIGIRNEADPHLVYLVELETQVNMQAAQVEVLTTLMTTQLGVDNLDYMKCVKDVLSKSLERLQNGLGVTGWDDQGNPLLDLAKYGEVTKHWPR